MRGRSCQRGVEPGAAALPGSTLQIERRYALDEAAAAHRAAEGGHTVGKLVVVP
ncbi:zinc-binding dehydrogenase [Curtobacterium sp. MCPF17_001]|uniref:zinc-binding dehydrogenase n=1 Tax=Curtobacterium sp. MCPF17_001 TaxID=2175651 RepID=UPI001C648CC3